MEAESAHASFSKADLERLQRALMSIHENSGHRAFRARGRALKISGADPRVVGVCRLMKCTVRQELARTKPRRPATLPKARYLGDVVHVDLLQAEDVNEDKFWYLSTASTPLPGSRPAGGWTPRAAPQSWKASTPACGPEHRSCS